MPLVINLSRFLMFMYCLGFNETLSEALPLVSLTQGDNSFYIFLPYYNLYNIAPLHIRGAVTQ